MIKEKTIDALHSLMKEKKKKKVFRGSEVGIVGRYHQKYIVEELKKKQIKNLQTSSKNMKLICAKQNKN